MSSTTIHVLGRVGVSSADGVDLPLQAGQRQVLALLVAAGPDGASLDWLANELWVDAMPSRWQVAVRMGLSRLRKRSGLAIPLVNGRYRLDLDPGRVDAWMLLGVDPAQATRPPILDLVAEPLVLPDLELSDALRRLEAEIRAAQRSLIEVLCRTTDLDRTVLARFARQFDRDPTDERLCVALATASCRLASPAEAADLIDRCQLARAELVGDSEPSPGLIELRRRLPAVPTSTGPVIDLRGPTPSTVPPPLASRAATDLVGRDAELATLTGAVSGPDPATLVVRGRAGSGKTSLLAAVAERIVAGGGRVGYAVASAGGRVAFAPLVTVVPALASVLSGLDDDQGDARTHLARAGAAFLDGLASTSTRRMVVLIDDAQWLDGPSCEVLDVVVRSLDHPNRPHVVLAARSDRSGPTPWSDLQHRLDRFGACSELPLGPLSAGAIGQLVTRRRPDLSLAGRAQLTRWLATVSQGLPVVVAALMDGGPGEELPTEATAIFDRLVQGIEPGAQRVGGAAAVIGSSFGLDAVTELAGFDQTEVLDALDVLLDRELIAETSTLDSFEFSHQLVADAFTRNLSASRRARMHVHAAALATDVHQRSRHLLAAGRLVDPAEAASAATEAGRSHLRNLAFWEAGDRFRAALKVQPGAPDPTVLVDYARALSLSGAYGQARGVRRQAYDLATAEGRLDVALDVAISGLPEAELPDGELDRFEALRGLAPHRLDPSRRFRQALHAARLATQLGLGGEGRAWSAVAADLAVSDDEQVEAALGGHFALLAHEHPADRLGMLRSRVAGIDLSPVAEARVAQLEAIDLLGCGAVAGARSAQQRFVHLADELVDPLRQWHAALFDALLHEIDGRWDAADARADEALHLGRSVGIDQADVTRLAQRFFRLRASRHLGLLGSAVDQMPVHDGGSQLFAAARALILEASGRPDEATTAVVRLGEQVTSRVSASSVPVLALVAPLLGRVDVALRRRARDLLEPFGDSMAVVGAGIGMIGPVRLLASSIDPAFEPVAGLEAAIGWVDRAGLRLFQVELRVELAGLTGSESALSEARDLAAGTDLEQLLVPTGPGAETRSATRR